MSLQELILGPVEDDCVVCGKRRCADLHIVRGIAEPVPLDHSQDYTTPIELGHPQGIYVLADGTTVQDGTRDGGLLYGPSDLLTLVEARRLGLLPSPSSSLEPPEPETRAVHGPIETRHESLKEDRVCARCRGPMTGEHGNARVCRACRGVSPRAG